jgi:hypothetical protein
MPTDSVTRHLPLSHLIPGMEKHKPKMSPGDLLLSDPKILALTKQYEIEFKAENDAYMKCKQCYESNTMKAYALLWETCSKGIKGKIEACNYD